MGMAEKLLNSLVFWAAWIIIPLIMEIVPSVGSFIVLIKKLILSRKEVKPIIYPDISVIIPVYNSEATLGACIKSIYDCDYPNEKIRIFLVDNQGKDNSFQVFKECQEKYDDLLMQWLNAQQGKSRALNLALYNSQGKYIIHIDSDGVLEKSSLTHLVNKFEADLSINCVTGAVLTEPRLVEEYPAGLPRFIRKLEFMEYAQAFLAGRNYASELNNIYTLSGAYSAFRKSAILKSRMYNTDTICEDTQITFQMRYLQGERVRLAEKSLFFVDPIENMNKLYTQRQRWQRGSLEVSNLFLCDKMKVGKMLTDVNIRTLMYDHTFAFPRMIWYLALICLMCIGYSGKTILMATGVLFGFYIVSGMFYYFSVIGFLRDFKELQRYYAKQWWVVPFLPLFNLLVFFIRFAGVINSINTDSVWKTRNLTDEKNAFFGEIKKDIRRFIDRVGKIRSAVNNDPVTEGR